MIDTTSWKKFHLYDGIFDIDMGTKMDKSKMREKNPTVNFVGRANANNGITTKVDEIEGIKPYKAGYMTLSLGGEYLGSCFIQPEPFYTSQNVVVLIPKFDMSDYIKRFLGTVIFKESRLHYKAFVNELNRHIKTDFEIYLPVDSNGNPDWNYMEDYMKRVMEKAENSFNNLNKVNGSKHLINVSKWGDFKVGELFKIHPTKAYKNMTNAKLLDNGDTPVIANSSYNNGIGGTSTQKPTEKGNMITFSDTVDANTIFYQPEDFVGYPHVQGLYPIKYEDKWNELTYQFFVSVFRGTALSKRFDYDNKFRRDIATELIVKLPITSTGEPDWNYMEDYMQKMMDKSEQIISKMQSQRILKKEN